VAQERKEFPKAKPAHRPASSTYGGSEFKQNSCWGRPKKKKKKKKTVQNVFQNIFGDSGQLGLELSYVNNIVSLLPPPPTQQPHFPATGRH
jgi:hypothetical protein